MIIANADQLAEFTAAKPYDNGAMHDAAAARVNAAVVAATGGKLPCYAARITRDGLRFVWVSVGSSAVIGRGTAQEWLSRFGADIKAVENKCLQYATPGYNVVYRTRQAMAAKIEGRFYVLAERLIGGEGYTVRDHRATVIYRLTRKSEADQACDRLNVADRTL